MLLFRLWAGNPPGNFAFDPQNAAALLQEMIVQNTISSSLRATIPLHPVGLYLKEVPVSSNSSNSQFFITFSFRFHTFTSQQVYLDTAPFQNRQHLFRLGGHESNMVEIGELAQFRLRNGIKIKGSILAIPERTDWV